MSSNSTKVFKGLTSQTVVTLLLGVVEIVTFAILSRLLSKQDFGYYAAISAVSLIFKSFSEAGIGSAIIQKKDFSESYRDTAFTISLVMGLSCALLLLATSGFLADLIIGNELQKPLMVMSIVILCHSLISVNISQMKKKLMFMKVGLLELSARVIAAVVAVYMAYTGYGIYAIIANSVLFSLLYFLFSRIAVGCRYHLVFHRDQFRSIVSFGGWLTASVLLRNLYHQMDKLLLGRLLSVELLGLYNRPKEFITSVASKLNAIFDTVLFPILSDVQDNKSSLQTAFTSALYYLNIFGMLLALSFMTNHHLLIRIFLGEKWMSTSSLFIILSCALVFNINGRLSDVYFRSLALVKYQFFIRVIQVIVMALTIIIGSMNGIVGVAIGYLIAEILMISFKVIFIARRIEVPVAKTFKSIVSGWRFFVFVLPVSVLLYFLMPDTILGNLLTLLVYGAFIFVLFFLFPQSIGKRYFCEIYPRFKDLLTHKSIHRA